MKKIIEYFPEFLKNEDDLKNENDLKNEDGLKNEDDLKNEDEAWLSSATLRFL